VVNANLMSERYEPSAIEPKWQAYWEQKKTFRAERRAGRPKLYALDMFPYPSGSGLHVGHPLGYTATDIVSRYRRMCGWDVLHPMGWDAFGLPAEQHAIQTGTHPRVTTEKNTTNFRRQLKALGLSYDWDREVDTTNPQYYRWTQWIFLKLFERGLAVQEEIPVNWCAALGTVLANEEVIDGKSERGNHPVERVPLRQWVLKITKYADRLDADLDGLDWPETREKQRYWIGRSEGAEVDFQVDGFGAVTVFTTRPDTLPGVTYLAVAPEHALAKKAAVQSSDVAQYIEAAKNRSDRERSDASRTKTGVPSGFFAKSPVNGDMVPVYVADYVIGTYGTGAVMAVPAHDERDHAFAQAYQLPIVQVVRPVGAKQVDVQQAAFTEDGEAVACRTTTLVDVLPNGLVDGTPSAAARSQLVAALAQKGSGRAKITYRLRDWVFSRQRFWGEPFPIYFPVISEGDPRTAGAALKVDFDKPIAVSEQELPLLLPELSDYQPSGDPVGPLGRVPEWRFFQKDGKWYARETNTMPQWAGSCWYYLRYLDPTNNDAIFSKEAYDAWMPVDLYVGGAEHAVLHLLYARFWHKVLFDAKIVSHKEPFLKLVHQGIILGENNEKMAKSSGNVINPDDIIRQYGADALRMYEMFMGPLEAVKPWQTNGVEGVRRFLDRVYAVCMQKETAGELPLEQKKTLHRTIAKVTQDIESMRFNTCVSSMMILSKELAAVATLPKEAKEQFALILAPFAPHLAEELWETLGHTESIAYAPWPKADPALLIDDEVEIGVQVNGKVRTTIRIAKDAEQAAAVLLALKDPKLGSWLNEKEPAKIIYVPGRILNLIAAK
jgi:leucyl-tRNA synthetase